MSSSDFLEPPSSPLDDPRLQFYLRNRDQIREWAALEQEVREATRSLLFDLRRDLVPLAESLGDDVVIAVEGADSSYPRLTMRRSSWPAIGSQSIVAVALEWMPKVDLAGSETPWVGVRVQISDPQGKALDVPLRAAFAASEMSARGFALKGYAWWPVIRRLKRNSDWWKDGAGAWRQSAIDEYAETWRLASPVIDAVVAADGA